MDYFYPDYWVRASINNISAQVSGVDFDSLYKTSKSKLH